MVAPTRFRRTAARRSLLVRRIVVPLLAIAGGGFVSSVHTAQAITRQCFDCGDPFGDTTCYLNFGSGNYIYGRSEGEAPRGPNPNHLIFANGRDVYGSVDVDILYDLLGQLHPYYTDRLGRNGPNNLGGTGNGTSVPFNVYRVFANADGSSLGPTLCDAPEGSPSAAATATSVVCCMGSTRVDSFGHEAAHLMARYSRQNPNGSFVSLGGSGQAGTLNESMGDFFGEAFERYVTGSNDWRAGVWADGVTADRDMADPPSQPQGNPATGNQHSSPDRYLDPDFYVGSGDNGGVHFNAGILNKAAYLAVEGGFFNGYSVAGIGFDKVEQIWYRALTTYFEPAETFNQAYGHIIQAASDLYGPEDVAEVMKALQAVEMNLDRAHPPGDFNGNGYVGPEDLVDWTAAFGVDDSADADGDHDSDGDDYLIWQRYLGAGTPPPSVSVPEPSAGQWLVVVALACMLRRRRAGRTA